MKISQLFILSPVFNIAQSLTDNLFRKTNGPILGSIVYCDLAFGYAEHSGVYIGDNRIVHRNGKGEVEVVSSRGFLANTTAITIYVSCDSNGQAVGDEEVALQAVSQIGQVGDYELLGENCHQFCSYCLTGDSCNSTSLLSFLKYDAKHYINATQWRAWDLLTRP